MLVFQFSASVIIVFLMLIVGGILTFVYLSKVRSNMRVFLVRSISHYQDDDHLQDALEYIQKRVSDNSRLYTVTLGNLTFYQDNKHSQNINISIHMGK